MTLFLIEVVVKGVEVEAMMVKTALVDLALALVGSKRS